jgi:hypothetical protein
VYKPGNLELPSKENLEKMAKANDDGQGFMVPVEGVVIGKKFSTLEKMWDVLRKVPKKYPLVIHFRLATHGGKSMEYAQPFPFPIEDVEELFQETWTAPVGIAHNGILTGFGDSMYGDQYRSATYLKDGVVKVWDEASRKWVDPKKFKKEGEKKPLSDTQDFIKYLSDSRDIARAVTNWDKACLKLMGKLLTGKFAFLNKRGKVKLIGDWSQEKGIWYSNLYWKNRVTTTCSNSNAMTMDEEDWKAWRTGVGQWEPGKRWDLALKKYVWVDEERQKKEDEKKDSEAIVKHAKESENTTPDATHQTMLAYSGMYGEGWEV